MRLPSPRLLQLQRGVVSADSEMPDELLYGRAGYLYALLYVNKEIGPDTVDETTIARVRATSTPARTYSTHSGRATMSIIVQQHTPSLTQHKHSG